MPKDVTVINFDFIANSEGKLSYLEAGPGINNVGYSGYNAHHDVRMEDKILARLKQDYQQVYLVNIGNGALKKHVFSQQALAGVNYFNTIMEFIRYIDGDKENRSKNAVIIVDKQSNSDDDPVHKLHESEVRLALNSRGIFIPVLSSTYPDYFVQEKATFAQVSSKTMPENVARRVLVPRESAAKYIKRVEGLPGDYFVFKLVDQCSGKGSFIAHRSQLSAALKLLTMELDINHLDSVGPASQLLAENPQIEPIIRQLVEMTKKIGSKRTSPYFIVESMLYAPMVTREGKPTNNPEQGYFASARAIAYIQCDRDTGETSIDVIDMYYQLPVQPASQSANRLNTLARFSATINTLSKAYPEKFERIASKTVMVAPDILKFLAAPIAKAEKNRFTIAMKNDLHAFAAYLFLDMQEFFAKVYLPSEDAYKTFIQNHFLQLSLPPLSDAEIQQLEKVAPGITSKVSANERLSNSVMFEHKIQALGGNVAALHKNYDRKIREDKGQNCSEVLSSLNRNSSLRFTGLLSNDYKLDAVSELRTDEQKQEAQRLKTRLAQPSEIKHDKSGTMLLIMYDVNNPDKRANAIRDKLDKLKQTASLRQHKQ
jgi:hypothetical protein